MANAAISGDSADIGDPLVSPQTLAKYVGVYSGLWGQRTRTVRIQLEGGTLYANGLLDERVRLIPHSDTTFIGTDGYSFDFDSPTGLAGPKGMDPAIVQKLHDAFKKAYDDPSMVAHYEKVQFSRRYLNSADYTALAAKLYADEKEALAKVGLLKKD